MRNWRQIGLGCLVAFMGVAMADEPIPGAATQQIELNIAAQAVGDALNEFGRQSGLIVMMYSSLARGAMSPALVGAFTPQEALERLLASTTLTYEFVDGRTVAIRVGKGEEGRKPVADHDPGVGVRVAQVPSQEERQGKAVEDQEGESTEEREEESEKGGIPEILVTGSKVGTLNADIRRTEDDIQPYILFNREEISRSGATNVEEFFKNELTMGVSVLTAAQNETGGNRSSINLRGLGADETLILIDGRRAAGFNFVGDPQQPDINGIPLAAIERIEVLPTTASGVFGGGATGGVINIVLRRDYTGLEARLAYSNSFKSDVTSRRIDLSAGFNFDEGKTNLLLAGSYADANSLLVQERNFIQRGREHILKTNPASFYNAFNPPLGATPNIRSDDSIDLVLDNGTPLNSAITFVPVGYTGAIMDEGAALVANAGQYNLALAPTAQNTGGERYGLLSAPEVKSIMMTLRRTFASKLESFLELQTSRASTEFATNVANLTAFIPGDAPTNPFRQNIRVTVPTVGMDRSVASEAENHRAIGGVIAQLPADWQAALEFTWSRSRSSYVLPQGLSPNTIAAVNSGSLDVLRDISQFPVPWEGGIPGSQTPSEMELKNTTMRLAGPLPWSLPGGAPTISSLIEYREESIGDVTIVCGACGGSAELYPRRFQSVSSAYVEARFPLISMRNRWPGIELLEFQVAARWDDYRVTGALRGVPLDEPMAVERFRNKNTSVDPTVGFRYQPMPDVMFRASYGTGYLPPSMSQIAPLPPSEFPFFIFGLTDPLRGNEPIGTLQFFQGGNSKLVPEESESWSTGLVVTPRALPGLRIGVDWTRIEKINNIDIPFSFGQPQKSLETLINFFPGRLIRGEPSAGFSVGPIVGLDNTLINIAVMQVEAIDLSLDYKMDVASIGSFEFSMDATRVVSRRAQAAPNAPIVENVGVTRDFNGDLRWKANASLNWIYGPWNLGWRTRFFDSYYFDPDHGINLNQGASRVPGQIYHDLYGGYRFSPTSASVFSMLADVEIQFGVSNVFNKIPPIDVVNALVMYSQFGDPRLANYYMSIRKSFGN